MSVLKLRRDMVVVDADKAVEPAVEIHAPLPLRTIEVAPRRPAPAEIVEPVAAKRAKRVKPRKTFLQKLRGWTIFTAVLAAIGAYPALVLMASDVGDKVAGPVDRAQWTVPWAGGAAIMLERQYGQAGWAKDAPGWAPMARLTAKPAYQQALAASLGDFVSLRANASPSQQGRQDSDLSAAARLLTLDSSGVQARAAHDALVNYDRRVKRHGAPAEASVDQLSAELKLVLDWAAASQAEIARASERKDNPIDRDATVAVYAAKGRAMAAWLVLDTLAWPASREAEAARAAAVAAWKQAAEFHPILVLNGNPDGSVFGNHPTSMGFAIARAETATQDFRKLVLPAATGPLANLAEADPGSAAALR